MLVSTQKVCAEQNLDDVISSNLSQGEKSCNTAVNRLKSSISSQNNTGLKNKLSTYEDDFKPRQLTADEKNFILITTLKLGNLAVLDESKVNNHENFAHSYSLRYIEIEPAVIKKHYKRNIFEYHIM